MVWKSLPYLGLVLGSTLLLDACGSGNTSSSTSPVSTAAFAINTTSVLGRIPVANTIFAFTENVDGSLTEISRLNLDTFRGAAHIAAVSNGRFLFSVQDDSTTSSDALLKRFAVDTSRGTVTLTPSCAGVSLPGRMNVRQPAVLPKETFVYVGSTLASALTAGLIDIFHIDPSGCPISSVTQSGVPPVLRIATNSDGTRVYILYQDPVNTVQANSINGDSGSLTQIGQMLPSFANANCTELQVHPTRQFLYVGCLGDLTNLTDGFIEPVLISASGQLMSGQRTFVELSVFAIHPGGAFLYGISNNTRLLTGYRIDETSGVFTVLQELSDIIFPGGEQMAFSPDGKFVYVGSSLGLFIYQVRSDGILTALPNATVPTGVAQGGWQEIVFMQ